MTSHLKYVSTVFSVDSTVVFPSTYCVGQSFTHWRFRSEQCC